MASDDRLITAFAAENNLNPSDIDRSRVALAGGHGERETP